MNCKWWSIGLASLALLVAGLISWAVLSRQDKSKDALWWALLWGMVAGLVVWLAVRWSCGKIYKSQSLTEQTGRLPILP